MRASLNFQTNLGQFPNLVENRGDEEKNPIKITPNPELFVTQTQFAGCEING